MKYEQVHEGDVFELPRELVLGCCDCGLVHRLKFRMKTPKGENFQVVTVQFNVDAKETKTKRREKGVKVVKTKKKVAKVLDPDWAEQW